VFNRDSTLVIGPMHFVFSPKAGDLFRPDVSNP
jgi:hypothetical protein